MCVCVREFVIRFVCVLNFESHFSWNFFVIVNFCSLQLHFVMGNYCKQTVFLSIGCFVVSLKQLKIAYFALFKNTKKILSIIMRCGKRNGACRNFLYQLGCGIWYVIIDVVIGGRLSNKFDLILWKHLTNCEKSLQTVASKCV